MTILIIIVILTVFLSANCSLYEAVLYSTRRGTLESVKTQRKHGRLAQAFIGMKDNISRPIAAILILNTLANTAGASIAGMYATEVLGSGLVPVFSIIFTLLILFLSEIIPKTFGAVHWKSLWPAIVYPLKLMNIVLSPLVWVTEKVTRLITRKEDTATITEDEILALVHLGAREGEISHDESRMVKNIITLEEKKVEQVMTPRRMIFSINGSSKIDEVYKEIIKKEFSRIPLFEGDSENITGYVLAKDVFSLKISDRGVETLKSVSKPITFITEEINCLQLLNSFLKMKKHVAVVQDEFGGVAGLVTLEDLLETALGTEIVDETDKVVDLQQSARKKLRND